MIDPLTPDFALTPTADGSPHFGYAPADPAAAPCVSIVTPYFNTGALFHDTARSVLLQSLQQWEWIVVNDASTDSEALAVLQEYRTRDPRIRIIDHDANRGLGAARNTGIRAAHTPYVVLLDSDDLLEPTAIEKWFWHLETFPQHAFVKGFGVGFGAREYLWTRGFHDGSAFLDENLVDATSMIRRSVHSAVGGFDESTRGGLEDWDFWLKCAAQGYWGSTVPEFLNWYRRRADHTDRWANLGAPQRETFRATLRKRYPHLWEGKFPVVSVPNVSYAAISEAIPADNVLRKHRRRMLMILPWLALGGADKFNLDLLKALLKRDWEVSIATTMEGDYRWLPVFCRSTPDIFALPHFLRLEEYPRFLSYLVRSRGIDAVLVSNSELGYKLLPWLRAHHPGVTFIDYCHMEEEGWNNGGYPRLAVQYQEQLDLNIVSSAYLKGWMIARGADADRVEVSTTNIDTQAWRPEPGRRQSVRAELKIPEDLPVIIYPCRIAEQKQPEVFLDALRIVHGQQPGFVALVAGDGPELPSLKQRAAGFDFGDSLRFLGAVSNERVHELMTAADILFLPSKWEGIALTLYEAMACGLAVVGAAVGGQAELVIPGTGILITPSTPGAEAQEYARILIGLLRSPSDLARLKAAARDRVVKEFGIDRMGDRMVSLCDLAAAHHARHPRPGIPAGLARSTALEAIEMQRHPPNALWYAGISDAARTILGAVHSHVTAGQYGVAVSLLEPLRQIFSEAKDEERVTLIEAQISRIKGMQAAGDPRDGSVEGPLVSVVIPCYNQAEFLPEAMQSVFAQTHGNCEIIVVNDGSPDNTSEVVRDFQRRFPAFRIRLIEQPNRGLPAARNAGIRASHAQFCVTLDADDRIAPAFVARCLAEIAKSDRLGFAYSHIRRFGEINDVYELPPFDATTIVHHDNTAAVCALIRTTMWESVGGYNEEMREGYEDWDFWIGAVEKGWAGVRIPEPLFEYRIKRRGMLRDANARRPSLIARIIQNHPALYDDRTRKWAEQVLAVDQPAAGTSTAPRATRLRITYLIHNLLGVTGGNQTLLQQANALAARGHEVTIVSYSEPPAWMALTARVFRVHPGTPMARAVPPSDIVIATYFLNALELPNIDAPVKVYFAQGDQFAFQGRNENPAAASMQRMSVASYALPGVTVVANSANLARRIETIAGRRIGAILPVCVDRAIFHPIDRDTGSGPPRILIVGPDDSGTDLEPLGFKGIGDIRSALEILRNDHVPFQAVRISNTPPEIFKDFPCEFHQAPDDAMKTALYGTADILVYASHYDSCPRPPLEAMAAGIPVVCTNTDGAREYCVDEKNCLLVPVRSPGELAQAIRRVLGDADVRDQLIRGGLLTAGERPVEREWNELEHLLGTEVVRAGVRAATDVPAPDVSVIALVSRKDEDSAERFLEAVGKGISASHEIIRVDPGPDGYARACNTGLRIARGRFICVVHDGYRLPPHWGDVLAGILRAQEHVALVAPAVFGSNGGCERIPESDRVLGRHFPLRSVPHVCMMFRASLLAWAGMMNEADGFKNNEPAGFVYRTLLTGAEAVATNDVVLLPEGTEERMIAPVPFRPSLVPPVNPGDPLERMKRAVVITLDEARTLEYADRAEEAIQRLQKEIDVFPESPVLRSALAWLLLRTRRFDAASALIGATPDSVKRDPQWLLIAGYAMEGLGEYALARQCAEKALEVRPDMAGAHHLLGLLALDAGDAGEARAHIDTAIAMDRGLAEAHAQRGALLWLQGEAVEARASLERAFLLRPTEAEIIDGYLQSVDGDEQTAAALKHLEEARRIFPDHKRLASWHITVLSSLGRIGEAVEEASSALAVFGIDDALLSAALELRNVAGPLKAVDGRGISLCMIVKDEEADLARCLGSVRSLVDEIVIVDTGSTDRTRVIAGAMGATVIPYEWCDDYAGARNAGLRHAHGAWIFVLDADEVLAAADCLPLRRQVLALDPPDAGVVFTTRNYVREMDVQGWQANSGTCAEEAGTGWIGSDKVRAFPNRPDIRFEHAVHEVVEESLQRAGLSLMHTGVPVHHYGRLDTERTRRKARRYVTILRGKLAAGTESDSRSLLELAAQEQELGNHAEALDAWQRYLALHPGEARAELGLGVSLFELGRWAEARTTLARAMEHDPDLREAPVKFALAALHCGEAGIAREVMTVFCARTPGYLFATLALAAALACEDRIAESRTLVQSVERGLIHTAPFFRNLSADLARAGQHLYADRVTAIHSERKN